VDVCQDASNGEVFIDLRPVETEGGERYFSELRGGGRCEAGCDRRRKTELFSAVHYDDNFTCLMAGGLWGIS